MLLVTTPTIDGVKIKKHLGPVFRQMTRGEGLTAGADSWWQGLRGGRSPDYEKAIAQVRTTVINELTEQAREMGANALIGVNVEVKMMTKNFLIMCKGSATAVVIEEDDILGEVYDK